MNRIPSPRAAVCASVALIFFGVASASTVFVREKAGSIWQDGLFIGDGATGAMAYAPMHLEWTINRNDVFDSRVQTCDYMPHDEVMRCVATNEGHSVAFLRSVERLRTKGSAGGGDELTASVSAAILRIRFWNGVGWSMPSIPATRQMLDTETGELLARMTSPFLAPEALSFVERSRDVMVVEVSDPDVPSRAVVAELARPEDPRLEDATFSWEAEDGVVSFVQKLPGGETYAVAMSAPGEVTTHGRTVRTGFKGRGALFLAVRTARHGTDPRAAAVTAVRRAVQEGVERIRADNRAWWKGFWTKGARAHFASDESVDTQWHYSLYALASQFGAAPMPALNGLTYGPLDGGTAGIGSNCYVHDQNVQIPMMPFFPLNHAEFVKTFVETYRAAMPELERRTRETFGCRGAYLPLNMNPYGFEHPIADYRYTLCGGAYSGLVLAQAWWYTHDEAVLREVYPILKKFILFYTDTMTKDADGTCHFIWSVPPEIFTGTTDDTATVACLKPCLEAAVEAATRFGCDAAERTLWQDVLAHYPKIAKHSGGGWWCGPEIPDDHYMYGGHLFYPFFPSEADTDPETARKTLDYFRNYAVEVSYETPIPHPVHEWSAFYSGMATMRLFGGARGWRALKEFQTSFAKPNGTFSHNPILVTDLTREEANANIARVPKLLRRDCNGRIRGFSRRGPNDLTNNPDGKALVAPVLEGGAAFLMMASEALCQSWGGEVRLFPSVPPDFTGSFENFRIRGGRTVSAAMKDGRIVDYRIDGVAGGEAAFRTAEPVWHAGHETEMNEQLSFRGIFEWRGGKTPVMRLASSNPYRVTVNGRFAWYGPARGPKGFFRMDEIPLSARVGANLVEVECAGYNCASLYFQRQPSFLQAEIETDGKIALRTASKGGPDALSAYGTGRMRKTSRYSHARTFGEAYALPVKKGTALPLAARPAVPLLPRRASEPDFSVADDFIPVESGACAFDADAEVRKVGFVENAGKPGTDGYPKGELDCDLWDGQWRIRPVKGPVPAKADTYALAAGNHVRFDAPKNRTGFPALTVKCQEPGELHVLFDEHPVPGEFKPWRSVVANHIVWKFEEPGEYEIEAFEPYVLKTVETVATSGRFEISAPRLRLYRNADSRKASFRSSDPELDALFAAAEENFAQNAVDGFMDCPGRERAGWNCDAFFTARAGALLTGDVSQETLFLENFAKPPHFDSIDRGMIPMCYPSDFANGNYIPSWAMFFVLQLDEYVRLRGGDRALAETLRPRVLALVDFFAKYRNADGLLENLPRWVFVEWSKANDFVKGVNYPNNMIWAATLEAIDRLYGRPDLAAEAARMKETIRRQSWTGEWFRDQALRRADGTLEPTPESTETCQYYAFYFGTATTALYPELHRRLTTEFGPDRFAKGLYPRIHGSAPFVGNFMRLDWLGKEGFVRRQCEEIKGYFGYMVRRTGTIWENADSADNGSCCHGFASHVAVFIIRDMVGVKAIDRSGKTVTFVPPEDSPLENCELTLPVGTEKLTLGWRTENGRRIVKCDLPIGWVAFGR